MAGATPEAIISLGHPFASIGRTRNWINPSLDQVTFVPKKGMEMMTATLTIRDEELGGATLHQFSLELLTERITVRELIRSRVFQEVKDFNAKRNQAEFQGLVQPTEAERSLNGFRLPTPRQIDWKAQYEKAIEAFEGQQILVLVNDAQVETLEDEIEVSPRTTVSFLRLTPLVGG